MLIHDNDITPEQAVELRQLFALCFGAAADAAISGATLRAIYIDSGIVGHAAVDVRCLRLHDAPTQVALLGLVCVHPEHRGRGIGHRLITELHQGVRLPFLLNCGSSLVDYYSRLGYVVIAEAATYDRHGVAELDRDPVMGFANGLPAGMELGDAPVHLGGDF